jgi:dolichyl-phosphate-mannose-protein mannosyltransferase
MKTRPTWISSHGWALPVMAAALVPFLIAQEKTGGRENLLKNPSFESGMEGWEFSAWDKKGVSKIEEGDARDGTKSFMIENATADDSFLRQTVTVKPNTLYRLSGVIKTENVETKNFGATLSLEGTFETTKSIERSKSWTRVEFEFDTGPLATIKVGCRLGHNSSKATGKAWFDQLELVELRAARR